MFDVSFGVSKMFFQWFSRTSALLLILSTRIVKNLAADEATRRRLRVKPKDKDPTLEELLISESDSLARLSWKDGFLIYDHAALMQPLEPQHEEGWCTLGVASHFTGAGVCCDRKCGICAGSGCSRRRGGAEGCCETPIRTSRSDPTCKSKDEVSCIIPA